MFTAVALAGLLEASILLSLNPSGEAEARRLSRKRPVERDKIRLDETRVREKKLAASE
jgi:hypothetical protein